MKILLVTCRYPWPARRGDQMRALQFIEALSTHNEVRLLSPPPDAGSPAPPDGVDVEIYEVGARWSGALSAALRGQPVQAGLFESRDLERRLSRSGEAHDLVILQLARLSGLLRSIEAPVYVDLVDALSLNFSSRSRFDRWWLKPLLREESRRLAGCEAMVLEQAAGACVVCERDRDALLDLAPVRTNPRLAGGAAADRLHVVRLPMPVRTRGMPSSATTIALTGNLGYFVNHDAATWWLAEIWPRVSRSHPEARLLVAGDRASGMLRRAVERAGALLVPSPERLLDIVESARVCIAPMRCGSGVPVKVLEAWSVGTPVVASPYAAAGVGGQDREDLLVASTATEWEESIAACFEEKALVQKLVEGGRRRLLERHDAEAIGRSLRSKLDSAMENLPIR